jgi:hypothetical protein
MMKRALVLLAALAACGASQHGASVPGRALLRHVPADTPYLLATLVPSPRDEVEHELAQQRPRIHDIRERLREHGPNGRLKRFLTAVLDELEPNLTADGLDRMGLGADATAVIYALGILPAARITVKDGPKVDALVARLVQAGEGPAPKTGPHGRRWEIFVDGHTAIVIAVTDKELIVGMVPRGDLAHYLDLLYGDARLGPSLADSTRVDEVIGGYKLSPRVVGWVEIAAIVAALHDERSLAHAQVGAIDSSGISPACRAEGNALAAHAPRLVFGAEELSLRRQRVLAMVELDGELARDIMTLPVPAVGVGAPLGSSILSFGAAADVPKLLDLVRGRARRVLAAPYTCEELLGLNELAGKIDGFFAQPLPPWANDLRGFAVELVDVQAQGAGFGMPKIRGAGVLSAVDPIRLMDLAKRFLPQLPSVNVPPDGRPVKLPGGLLFVDAFVAMRGQLLGAAVGDRSDQELVRLMSERPLPEHPLGAFAADMEKLFAFVAEMQKLSGQSGQRPEMPPVPGRIAVTLTAEPKGLAFRVLHEETR